MDSGPAQEESHVGDWYGFLPARSGRFQSLRSPRSEPTVDSARVEPFEGAPSEYDFVGCPLAAAVFAYWTSSNLHMTSCPLAYIRNRRCAFVGALVSSASSPALASAIPPTSTTGLLVDCR
jgi:hypothetical protein